MLIAQVAPMGRKTRVSPQSAWPLRTATGETFAQRKERKEGKR